MKVIVGAGGRQQANWISTEQHQLDLLCREDFERTLSGALGFECILAEHLFEHLSEQQAIIAINNCFEYLAMGGRLRIAVPDGLHPSKEYINYVKPGGTGAGADSHQVLYTYRSLARLLRQAGFRVVYLEWWDEAGKFNCAPWNEIDGYIERCLANDPRNWDGKPNYTSLIMDAFKDVDLQRPGLEKAFAFVEEHDPHKMSPFNRKKTATFYELARLAPAHGVIVELGAHHGIGTAALWYGARDGHRCNVIAVDAYTDKLGWAKEPYTYADRRVWEDNMQDARINPQLIQADASELAAVYNKPVSLLVHDLGMKYRMPDDVMEWECHIMVNGMIAMRDIDDYSMGTEAAVRNLMATGRWDRRRNWDAFITSMEKIA